MKKIIITIFLLFIISNVKASTPDTNVRVEWVPNVYYNYEKDGTKYWGQFGYIYADNELVYCMDINNIITTNIYSSSTNISVNKDVREIIYFGYGYKDHTSIEDYMATQQLVWEYQGQTSYFTTKSGGGGNVINVESYKKKIKKYKDAYPILPTFNKTFNFVLGSTNIIPDQNKVLSNFVLGNNNKNDISIDGNNIVIKTTKRGEGSFGVVTNYPIRGDNKVYSADNSQALIKINSIENKAQVYRYMVYSGDLRINIYDNLTKTIESSGGANLKGNIFKLYDSNNKLINTYESLKDGIILIDDLSLGNYILEHSNVSEGYIKNKEIYNINIVPENIHQMLDIYLNPISTTLNIRSTYGNPRVGTVYGNNNEVYNIVNSKGEKLKEIITDENGEATINLIYDEYKIYKEGSNSSEYYKIDKNNFNIVHNYNIFTPVYNARLKIHLLDSENKLPISNVKFMLNNNEYITNKDGIILTEYLEIGKYLLEEELPKGYYKVDDVMIEIDEDSKYYMEKQDIYIDIFIYNERIREIDIELIPNGGKISFNKYKILEIDKYGFLPIPTKENNKFVGWYTKSNVKIDENTMYSSVKENILYAHYEKVLNNDDLVVEDLAKSVKEEKTDLLIIDVNSSNIANENDENKSNNLVSKLPNLYACNNTIYLTIYFALKKDEKGYI